MTEKRFVYYEHKGADYILDTPNKSLDFIEMLGDCLEAEEIVDLLNCLNEENKQLKQFQEQVASVIEGKMGDNVCNDYKMEVLKEIWNELELDEVWFETKQSTIRTIR